MKRIFGIFLAAGLLVFLWVLNQQSRPVLTGTERPLDQITRTVSQAQHERSTVSNISDTDEVWIKNHSAGLTISQTFDPVSNEAIGMVISGKRNIDLGETPPVYRYQLQAAGYPIMLGDKHERRTFEIQVSSLLMEPDEAALRAPLSVRYPRWANPKTGLESSGGLVFMRDEDPLTKVGVMVPKVIPEQGDSDDSFEWQIQIRVNDRLSDVDARTQAKPQSLGVDVVVLMPTHPDRIPASSPVVWFKFEKDGTVSLENN